MQNWILNAGKTIGRDHIGNDMPCQDDIKTLEKNGVSVIALSDGCGSQPLSEYGAKVTVDTLCEVLTENFDELFKKDAIDIKKRIHTVLIGKLSEYVLQNKKIFQEFKKENISHYEAFLADWEGHPQAEKVYPITLLDATVQFVARKQGKTLIGRLGDGFIGQVADKALKIVSSEDKNGRKKNMTVYPSVILLWMGKKESVWNFFEILKQENDTSDMYLVCSDGFADAAIRDLAEENYKEGAPRENSRCLFDDALIEEVLQQKDLSKYLEENRRMGPFLCTGDDLSIAILRRETVAFDKLVIREYDELNNTIANDKVMRMDCLLTDTYGKAKTEHKKAKIVTKKETKKVEGETEYSAFGDIPCTLDNQQIDAICKLCKKDEEKCKYILAGLSILKNILVEDKTLSFDEALNLLSPYADEGDLKELLSYAKKIKLLTYDKKKEILTLGRNNENRKI